MRLIALEGTENELKVLSTAAPRIPEARLHETKGYDEGQTAINETIEHKCNISLFFIERKKQKNKRNPWKDIRGE